jgi:hypothetical protein
MLTSRERTTLTASQVDLFEQKGLLIRERVLGEERILPLRESLADLLNRDPARRTGDFVVDTGSTTALRNINHFTRYRFASRLSSDYAGPNRSAVSRHGPIIQYRAPSPAIRLREYPADTPFGETLVWPG